MFVCYANQIILPDYKNPAGPMSSKENLRKLIRGKVLEGGSIPQEYSRDASLFQIKPEMVVIPDDTEDVRNLINFVSENSNSGLSVTVRGGATDMTGGPLSESIVVDIKNLNRIVTVGDGYATAEMGVPYRDFEKATLEHGYLLPTFPASREVCVLGGMVANNSGGEKSLIYGQTKDYVQRVRVILRDGKEYEFGPLSEEELKLKFEQEDLEGELYRKAFELIEKNYELIQKSKPKVSKNSAGYFLWDVWNKKTFNLAKLFAGSQGTLGIITEASFGLIKPKEHTRLLVIFLKDFSSVAKVVNAVLKHNPESFETFDDKIFNLMIRFLPGFVKVLGKNIFSLAWQFLPELKMFVTGGVPKLVLLAEFNGDTKDEALRKAQAAQMELRSFKLKTHIARTQSETDKYWTMRRQSFTVLRKGAGKKRTAPFIDDMIISPDKLPEFLPRLEKMLKPYNLVLSVNGHIGNGNLHIIPLMDPANPKLGEIIHDLSKKVYDMVVEFGGSISGEHNDGLVRGPYLEQMYGKEMFAVFKQVKQIFDPDNIFNPKKKTDANLNYTMAHLRRN
jgi:FAD/FMN-containing dehydrogenase